MASARALCPPLLLLLAAAGAALAKLPLPPYVRPCSFKLSDRKLSECALKSARDIWPNILKGDPKYKVPVLDPMHLDRLVVIDGKGPLGMQLIARDVKMYGLPDAIINSTTHRSNPQDNTYVATIPLVHITAKYNVSGRILLLPIVGQGNVVMDLKNVKLVYQFDFRLEKLEDGETYYIPLPGARLDLDVDGMTIKMDNLFNGDGALLDTTNNFLNEEWREVFDSLRPSFAKAISEVITDILNGIFRQVPFKDAFLDVDAV
ncbi:hypothetical protein R5R35_001268 [Gryllus longicercus]|uniref:Takeout n=1 Tax=Gryllus longicercus TaxID=2509291 RepID=A0AAN9VM09_9ORTH